jgi:uncharacterized protein (DUF2384 family)
MPPSSPRSRSARKRKGFTLPANIEAEAIEAFGDADKAREWLKTSNRVMGGKRPIDMLTDASGLELVRRALGVVAYGGLA